MNDIQFSEHLIEQDEIIDVKGITSPFCHRWPRGGVHAVPEA